MDFAFTDEQKMIADTAREFFRKHATSASTRKAMADDGVDRPLWTSFCTELGLAGAVIPEEFGGAGLGMVELAIIAEAAGSQVSAIPLLGQAMATGALMGGASDDQKQKWLDSIASGDTICAVASSKDVSEADGKLTGSVIHTPHGAVADLLVVLGESRSWLVSLDGSGVTIERPVTMDQTRPLATIVLDGASCEPLGDSNSAKDAAMRAGLIVLSAEALGGAQETLDRTVAHSQERVQFGRPIGSFQAYKHRLADMLVEIEQARSAVYWAACAMDENDPIADFALYAAKSLCADTYFRCAGDMIQLHGGIGFTWEHDAHLFFKRARAVQSLLGTGEEYRERIAQIVLGDAA